MFDSIHWHVYGFKGIVDKISGFGIIGNVVAGMGVTPEEVQTIAAIAYAVLILLAYFVGNISPSTILAKRQGLDIKKEGSGNAGTTNALRVMGKKAGLITLVVDIMKGVLVVVLSQILAGEGCAMYCAVAVILGHVWPVVYKFKGGKGVATTFGALTAINPLMGLWTLLVVAVVTFLSKRMSAGSIAGAVAFPVICLFNEPEFIVMGTMLAVIVLLKHRANIARLLEGEEPKLGFLDKDKKDADVEDAAPVASEQIVTETEKQDAEKAACEEQPEEAVTETEKQDAEKAACEGQPEEAVTETEKQDAEKAACEGQPDTESEKEPDEISGEPEVSETPKAAGTSEKSEEHEPEDTEKTVKAEEPVKQGKYQRPKTDKNIKKNGKKKKSYPNKRRNGGSGNKSKNQQGKGNNKGGRSRNNNNKNNNSKGKGNNGKYKKKGSKKK